MKRNCGHYIRLNPRDKRWINFYHGMVVKLSYRPIIIGDKMKKRYADKLILPSGYGPLDTRWINFKLGGAFVGKGNNLIIGD